MINVIGLCLVVASLVTAGVWSPGHTTTKTLSDNDDNLIVKEGHRVVVVEYDQDGEPVTKVSISPESHHFNSETSSVPSSLNDVKDKLGESSDGGGWRNPKELICDAYGRCKHRIAEAVGKTKDSVADTAHRVEEARHDAAETTRTTAHRVEEAVSGAAHGAEDVYGRGKETARQGAHEVTEEAQEAVKDVRDLGKTIGIDVAKNVTGFVGRLRNEAALTVALIGRALSPKALNPLSGTLYVLAFATAYGTGVWVTFVEGRVLATALPRSQFAVVQSKLFPVYFRTTVMSVATAAFWFVMVHRGKVLSSIPELLQVYNLLTCLILVLINTFFLEPKATQVMFERMRVEKEEGRGREEGSQEQPSTTGQGGAEEEAIRNRISELNGKLKKLNTWSSVLNLMCLMCLSWHVFYLGLRLHLTF